MPALEFSGHSSTLANIALAVRLSPESADDFTISLVGVGAGRRTGGTVLTLIARAALQDEILGCSWIADLEDGWDEHGSPGYAPTTLQSAATILRRLAALQEQRGSFLPVPKILPGIDGRVELRWRHREWSLLVLVHPDGRATYYGESRRTSVRGALPGDEQPLLEWIDAAAS